MSLNDGGPLGFVADLAVLRNPTAAATQLDNLAHELLGLPNARITLLGTTSSAGTLDAAGDAGRRTLSRNRARVVRDELVRRGVPASWFAPVQGDGYHFDK